MVDDWHAGYVTDVTYTQGVYRELTPSFLSFVALCAGVRFPNSKSLSYCELGCGHGLSTNLHAAANPDIAFFANDFNPAHIAGALELAKASRLQNVSFSDASFEEYVADTDSPRQFDFICLHGVYSWVRPEIRRQIVEFIGRRLAVGGLCFVSYNSQPGWAAASPLRRLIYAHSRTTSGGSLAKLDAALQFAKEVRRSRAGYFESNAGMSARLDELSTLDSKYLAHEYLNQAWEPLWSADVAEEMAAAKLSFVSTTQLVDRVNAISFTTEAQALLAATTDPALAETLKDYFHNQQFRRDLFVKGPSPLARHEAHAAWAQTRFVSSSLRDSFDLQARGQLGELALKPEIYGTLLRSLGEAPRTEQELAALPELATLDRSVVREALSLLVGLGRIQVARTTGEDALEGAGSSARFNEVVLGRAMYASGPVWLSSPVTGGAAQMSRLDQLFLLGGTRKEPDVVDFVARTLASNGESVLKDGVTVKDPATIRRELSGHLTTFHKGLPVLNALGVAA